MLATDVQGILKYCSSTTPGEWVKAYEQPHELEVVNRHEELHISIWLDDACHDLHHLRFADADFIAKAHTDLPACANEILRLQKVIKDAVTVLLEPCADCMLHKDGTCLEYNEWIYCVRYKAYKALKAEVIKE